MSVKLLVADSMMKEDIPVEWVDASDQVLIAWRRTGGKPVISRLAAVEFSWA